MSDFSIVQGEVGVQLDVAMKKASGVAYDATGDTVTLLISGQADRACTLADAANGIIRYTTVAGDATSPGLLAAEGPNGKGLYTFRLKFVQSGKLYYSRPMTIEVTTP